MRKLKYPRGKYETAILTVSFLLFAFIVTASFYIQGNAMPLYSLPLLGIIWISVLYKLNTYFLYINYGFVHLDQGLLRRKFKIAMLDIQSVQRYKLNNKLIGIVFYLKNGGKLKYKSPYPAYSGSLEQIIMILQNRLTQL